MRRSFERKLRAYRAVAEDKEHEAAVLREIKQKTSNGELIAELDQIIASREVEAEHHRQLAAELELYHINSE